MDSDQLSNFTNYVDKGGIVFVILLFFSIVSISIIILKIIQFRFIYKVDFDSLRSEISLSKSTFDFFKNNNYLEETNNPLLQILNDSREILLKNNKDENNKSKQITSLVFKHTKKLEKYLPSLEIIAQVSPLLGLLGTVIGMISSFNQLELGGSLVDPAVLAGGIWTALLTTAIGLIVAIPALISHYFFEKKISNIYQDIDSLLILLNNNENNDNR